MENNNGVSPRPRKKSFLKTLLIIFGIIIGVLLIFFIIGMFTGEGPESPAVEAESETVPASSYTGKSDPSLENGSWTLMFYLCGTDLESDNGLASFNLSECAQVDIPENVRLLICTGGTEQWQTEGIDNDKINYFRMSGQANFEQLERKPSASMGDAATLAEFLSYGVEEYPSEHYGAIIWNHGGGMGGVAFDELYEGDSLSISELSEAFSKAGAKIELAGFDACLMAALENAVALSPYASYMVASEESEPGTGWDYAALLSYLSDNPGADGADLGKVICDSYFAKCGDYSDTCTLSLTDLSKIEPLASAFDAMASEMTGVTGDIDRFRELSQDISKAENYGGNTDSEGYFNLIDIGDMVLNSKSVLSGTGDAVLDALFDAVIYNVSGSARANANGLSTYYPIKAEAWELDSYAYSAAFSKNYLTFFEASRRDWKMPGDFTGTDFSNAEATLPEQSVSDASINVDASTYLGDDGVFNLEISSGAEYISDVCFTLYQMDYDYDEYMFMGRDDDINVNDDLSAYSDNFRGVWAALNGIFVNLNLLESTDEYNLYSIPITLNGEDMNLRAKYNWSTESYEILGAVAGSVGNTFASRSMRTLEEGDKVEVVMVGSNWNSGGDTSYSVGSFTVKGTPVLEEIELTDGDYLYQYEITDVMGDVYYSETVIMECKNGEINVYETEDA